MSVSATEFIGYVEKTRFVKQHRVPQGFMALKTYLFLALNSCNVMYPPVGL